VRPRLLPRSRDNPSHTENAIGTNSPGVNGAPDDVDGMAKDIKVVKSLGYGLDEKAVEAVRKWRFEPAEKDGRPVAVQVNIEVSFRLY